MLYFSEVMDEFYTLTRIEIHFSFPLCYTYRLYLEKFHKYLLNL